MDVGEIERGEGDHDQRDHHGDRDHRRARPVIALLHRVHDQDAQRRRFASAEAHGTHEIAEAQNEGKGRRQDQANLRRGDNHQEYGPDPPAAEIVGRFDQAAVDIREAEELKQDHQRQAERQIADEGAEQRVQHRHRAEAEVSENGIQDAALREHRLPGIDAHDVACEERRDEQEDPEAAGRGRHLEGERVGRGKGHYAAHRGRKRAVTEGAQIRVNDIALAPHVDPVDGVETGIEPEVLHRPEGHHDEEGERRQEERALPEGERQAPEKRVGVGAGAAAGGGRHPFIGSGGHG